MSNDASDTQRDNQFGTRRRRHLSGSAPTCAAPGCTNPGGAFTSERGGLIYEFCSQGLQNAPC
jgi:hypothetical protein